ncbi:MAG TPA: glycosyltransferase family 2 protein [Chryseolinea sp.]|nr:glycosyltransferase family 2 protein [Chryseolinea sp.]
MISNSLIIATYNWPAALAVCLRSALQQSILPAEIIVADDGSGKETHELVADFAKHSTVPLHHVWQPDEGFQLAKIRNRAMATARGKYIIQVDGDLLLHRHFVKDHMAFARTGSFVSGSRVLMNAALSAQVLEQQKRNVSVFTSGTKNFFNGIHLPMLSKTISSLKKSRPGNVTVRGCNMGFWKEDIIRVNGYDEDFAGWGSEDWELAARLMNSGVEKRVLKMGGIVFHLHHKEAERHGENANQVRLQTSIREKRVWCENGIDKYIR